MMKAISKVLNYSPGINLLSVARVLIGPDRMLFAMEDYSSVITKKSKTAVVLRPSGVQRYNP
jgi:hypothetical protein